MDHTLFVQIYNSPEDLSNVPPDNILVKMVAILTVQKIQ